MIPHEVRKGPHQTPTRNQVKVCKMHSSLKTLLPAAVLALGVGVFASQAFAECDDSQEDIVGKAVAAAAAAKISAAVPTSGKQMINLDVCEAQGGGLYAEFKYNVIGADGLYWAQGKAKVTGKDVTSLTFTSLSPNLASASAKAGVKLASN